MPRDFFRDSPPAELPLWEDEEDVQEIFAHGFPYTAKTAAQIPTQDPGTP